MYSHPRRSRNDRTPVDALGGQLDEPAFAADDAAAGVAPVAVRLADVEFHGLAAVRARDRGVDQAAADEYTAAAARPFQAREVVAAAVAQDFADVVRVHRTADDSEHRVEHAPPLFRLAMAITYLYLLARFIKVLLAGKESAIIKELALEHILNRLLIYYHTLAIFASPYLNIQPGECDEVRRPHRSAPQPERIRRLSGRPSASRLRPWRTRAPGRHADTPRSFPSVVRRRLPTAV